MRHQEHKFFGCVPCYMIASMRLCITSKEAESTDNKENMKVEITAPTPKWRLRGGDQSKQFIQILKTMLEENSSV